MSFFYANNSYPMFEERKSKMAFAMKGGGGSRVPSTYFEKLFLKTIYNYSLAVKTCFAHSLGFAVVEVTMNMARYASSWQSAAGAAEECQ